MTNAAAKEAGSAQAAGGGVGASDAPGGVAPRRGTAIVLPVLIFAALVGLFAVALRTGDPTKIPSALIGKPAPQVALAAVPGLVKAGQPVPGFSTQDLKSGKPSVVNFWASWCVPCVDEHPYLTALGKQTGVVIYGVNQKDQASNARQFLAQHGNPYTSVGADANGRASIEWGVYGTPETFVVDGQGMVVYKHVGPISEDALQARILPALKKAGLGK
ncbi:MAG: DsbE family thiol:disulfide interchange protein [Hyphomicrobiaceae bacterium]